MQVKLCEANTQVLHPSFTASAPWSAPGRRRGWRGEEDDPVAGVADAWGPVCQLVLIPAFFKEKVLQLA